MTELKPCPFCDSPAELTHTKTWGYYVRCTDKACAARTRQYHENDVGAVSAWNKRAWTDDDAVEQIVSNWRAKEVE